MSDLARTRADFPILHQQVNGKPLVYLDNGATSQKPRAVIDALVHYYERDNSNVHRGLHTLSMRATDAYEGARTRIAKFIHAADPAEIIFTRGTTESINIVARSWAQAHLKPGDVILTTEMEHHSNLVPWQQAAKAAGATLSYIPVLGADAEGGLDYAALDTLLTPAVKLLAFTHISNTLGTVNDAAELCRRARAVGAVTLIDAAQSIGHAPIDVQTLGCDFLVRRRALPPRSRRRGRHLDRRRPVHRPRPDRRANPRLRLPRLFRPQDVRPHRHRRALRPPRPPRQTRPR